MEFRIIGTMGIENSFANSTYGVRNLRRGVWIFKKSDMKCNGIPEYGMRFKGNRPGTYHALGPRREEFDINVGGRRE